MSTTSNIKAINVQAVPTPRMPLFWRIFSYLFMFILVNLLANLGRVGLGALGLPSLISRLAFVIIYIAGVIGLTLIYRQAIDRKPWMTMGLPSLKVGYPQLVGGFSLGLLVVGVVFMLEFSSKMIQIVGYESGASAMSLLADPVAKQLIHE